MASYWSLAPEVFARALYNLYTHMLDGGITPDGFNDSRIVFPPKGKVDRKLPLLSSGRLERLAIFLYPIQIISWSLVSLLRL